MSVVNLKTLVLNNSYMPVSVFPLYTIPAQDAISRYLNGSCEVVFWYERPILTNSRHDLYWPSVIANKNSKNFKNEVRLKKQTLYFRDHCVCYWCNRELTLATMTYDHVMPRSHGGGHNWENVVSSCKDCNMEKSNALPTGRWAPKKYKPYTPTFFQLMDIRAKFPIVIHDENWLQFLPNFTKDNVIINPAFRHDEPEETAANDNVILLKPKKRKR